MRRLQMLTFLALAMAACDGGTASLDATTGDASDLADGRRGVDAAAPGTISGSLLGIDMVVRSTGMGESWYVPDGSLSAKRYGEGIVVSGVAPPLCDLAVLDEPTGWMLVFNLMDVVPGTYAVVDPEDFRPGTLTVNASFSLLEAGEFVVPKAYATEGEVIISAIDAADGAPFSPASTATGSFRAVFPQGAGDPAEITGTFIAEACNVLCVCVVGVACPCE